MEEVQITFLWLYMYYAAINTHPRLVIFKAVFKF